MGCIPSSDPGRVINRKDIRNRQRMNENSKLMHETSQKFSGGRKLNPRKVFSTMVNNIRQLTNPPDLVPLVCVGSETFPIITTTFQIEGLDSSLITLPVVMCSMHSNGLLTCVSSIDYLSQPIFNSADASTFFNQVVKASSYNQHAFEQAACLGFDKAELKMFRSSFEAMSLYTEFGDLSQPLKPQTIIIINTRYILTDEDSEKLNEHLENGGSIIVFINQNEDLQNISNFLQQFGIGFTTLIPTENAKGVTSSYENAVKNTFRSISETFISMTNKQEINIKDLGEIVTSLRIYILACNDDNTEQLTNILERCWKYLHDTNYMDGNKFFRTEQQEIIATLVIELLQKLPLESLSPIEGYELFPGATGENAVLSDFEIEVNVSSQEWTSTGLWVRAGDIAEVVIEDPPQNMYIQIGCHSEKSQEPLPWERWPSTTVVEPVVSEETRVGSPFGGLVYMMIGETDEVEPTSIKLKCVFKNCCQCPRYVKDGDTWEKTKDIEVPWGEIETENSIITLPSQLMKKIDIPTIAENLEQLISSILEFIPIKWDSKFRVIFDVVTSKESPIIAYPVVFSLNDFDNLMQGFLQPNNSLHSMLSALSFTMLQTVGIDEVTKSALASVSSVNAITNKFPDFRVESLNCEMPALFNEFWEIQTNYGNGVLSNTIADFQDTSLAQTEVPEDLWIIFVRKLSSVSDVDFSQLLIKARPIPLSVINSLHSLKQYVGK